MMTEFDPLSFFTPETVPEVENANYKPISKQDESNSLLIVQDDINEEGDENESDGTDGDDDNDAPLHILDLPVLNTKLPRNIIITLLKLLKNEEETNFGPQMTPSDTQIESVLKSKDLSIEEFQETQNWLEFNGYIKLSNNLSSIRFSQDFFQYLNRILSSRVFATDEEIIILTSLRISENSGRTARPNFTRKILLRNFSTPIYLHEPALTSDSLGLKTWGSSLILSEFLIANHEKLLVEPVLELGSGTGLVGISISLLGYKTTLTDLPEIIPNLQKNIEINKIDADCHVLDWTNPQSFLNIKGEGTKYKTIVIADPIYSSDHPGYVVNMIKLFLEKSFNSRVLLQIPIRSKFEEERKKLWDLLDENHFDIVDELISEGYDDFGAQQFIYKEIRWSKDQL